MTTARAIKKPVSSAIKTKTIKPLTNITKDKNGYTLYIAMPGMTKNDVEISLHKSDLVISATSKDHAAETKDTHTYRRVFQMPSHIDRGQITAAMNQGILQVSLTIQEPMKKKEIQIS